MVLVFNFFIWEALLPFGGRGDSGISTRLIITFIIAMLDNVIGSPVFCFCFRKKENTLCVFVAVCLLFCFHFIGIWQWETVGNDKQNA